MTVEDRGMEIPMEVACDAEVCCVNAELDGNCIKPLDEIVEVPAIDCDEDDMPAVTTTDGIMDSCGTI